MISNSTLTSSDATPMSRMSGKASTAKRKDNTITRNGLSISSSVVFDTWEPMGTYFKSIHIHNASSKPRTLLFQLPQTSIFTIVQPHALKISPKTNFSLSVIFCPKERKVYQDRLSVKTLHCGKFFISLKATIHTELLVMPNYIDMGLCPVKMKVNRTFMLKNEKDEAIPFVWETRQPFYVFQGLNESVAPLGESKISVTFQPQVAGIYEGEAICKYGKSFESCSIIYIYGEGIYPYLEVQGDVLAACEVNVFQAFLDFGLVNVGMTRKRTLTLTNIFAVLSPFKIVRSSTLNSAVKSVFTFTPLTGLMKSHETKEILVTYQPTIPGSIHNEYWEVIFRDTSPHPIVHVKGKCIGTKVHLEPSSIDFQEIEKGKLAKRKLKLINDSITKTRFQFQIDNLSSVFSFTPRLGVLLGKSFVNVTVEFRPLHPITYYRQVVCSLHNHDPVFIDVFGTAFVSDFHPEWLHASHIDTFWKQTRRGKFFYKDLNEVMEEKPVKPRALIIDEYLYDGYTTDYTVIPPPASLDCNVVDFGCCHCNVPIPPKIVSVTNHALFNVTVTWTNGKRKMISISPPICNIAPHRTGVFEVKFKPTETNQVLSSQLEAFVHCTGKGIPALNPGEHSWPPWCLTLTAIGCSKNKSTLSPLPSNYVVKPREIVFPPAAIHHHCAVSLLLINNDVNLPFTYEFTSPMKELVIKPSKGVVADEFQIITVGLIPRVFGPCNGIIKVDINNDPHAVTQIIIHGFGANCAIEWENAVGLFFKPTCIGMMTHRKFFIRSLSPIPMDYTWIIAPEYRSILAVEPISGTLEPNEIKVNTWTFTPMLAKFYNMSSKIKAETTSDLYSRNSYHSDLNVMGEGTTGWIVSEPCDYDAGARIVNTVTVVKFSLRTQGTCHLYIKLEIDQSLDGIDYQLIEDIQPDLLAIDFAEPSQSTKLGFYLQIPPQCQCFISLNLLPKLQTDYYFRIHYRLISSTDPKKRKFGPRQLLSTIKMTGAYPLLQVTDAQFFGHSAKMRKKHLWRLLSLARVNELLRQKPAYEHKTLQFDRNLFPLINNVDFTPSNVSIADFNFPPAPATVLPCALYLRLTNEGLVTANWNLVFPRDDEVEIEMWAQKGHFDVTELQQTRIKEDKLFELEPVKGKLDPGESQFLTVTYNHRYKGLNVYPVSLWCFGGIMVKLNLIGQTYEVNVPRVYFPFTAYNWPAVPIGQNEGTVLSYSVFNNCSVSLRLKIDVLPLRRMQKANYNHVVLDCLTRAVKIQPDEVMVILWRFWPLEPTSYVFEVPFKFEHEDHTRMVTFTTEGTIDPQPWQQDPQPMIVMPNQLLTFTYDKIAFGNAPISCTLHRMFYITNISATAVKWEWVIPSKLLHMRVLVEPKIGQLMPHHSTSCKLTLVTGHSPAAYDIYVYCEVSIAKIEPAAGRPRLKRLSIASIFSGNSSIQSRTVSVLSPSSRSASRGLFRSGPESPMTLTQGLKVVHLEITAQTYLLDDFCYFFPDDMPKFMIQWPRLRPDKDCRVSTKSLKASEIESTSDIYETIFEVVDILIYTALHDLNFKQLVEKIGQDPPPYFCNLVRLRESSSHSPSLSSLSSNIQLWRSASQESFDLHYRSQHLKVFGRQSRRPSPNPQTALKKPAIFSDSWVPPEIKIFPEAVKLVSDVLDGLVYLLLEEAERGEFSITSRPKPPTSRVNPP